ncbi:MAG: secretin N-terminal domain-containing protein [Verrucomicrobiota bacterium]
MASAQRGTIAPVAAPTPFVTPSAAVPPKSTAPPPAADMVTLQFPNSDVADVLHFYETLTGKKLIVDNFVQGKVNIFLSKPMPRDEAIKIIEMNLLLNGFSLVPAEGDIVKVIGTNRNARSAGVPIISDEADIPPGEHVITYVFKLKYVDPVEMQQVVGQYLAPAQPYSSFLALPKSASLLVTEGSDVIRKLIKIINQVDIPPAEVVSEFIKLERADASKVVDLLKDIFEKGNQPGAQNYPPGVRNIRTVVPQPQGELEAEGGAAVLSEESLVVGKIKLEADVRTNRIHVITRPVNMPFVRKLIAEFDANVEFGKPVTRPLKYIAARDVLDVLVQALTEPGENTQQGAGGAGNPQQQLQQPRPLASPINTASTGSLTGTASDSTLNVSEELSTQPTDTTPKAVTVGNTKLIADARANTIIILGNRDAVVKVEKILDEMDVRAPQVALSTVIGELTLNNDEEFGVDYFAKYKNKVVGISRNTTVPIPLPSASGSPTTTTVITTDPVTGLPVTTTTTNPIAAGGVLDPANLINFSQIITNVASGTNVYVAAGNYLSAIVHLLESTGNFKVISRPMVFTSNNKKAIIASGTEIPVPVNTISSATGSSLINTGLSQQTNIQFKKVALQLEVVPLINSDKEVSLDILQKIDSLAGSTIVDGNSIPNIATRYIRTNVSAANGATIVLGGLITDSKTKNFNGIKFLDRIPLLGYLFRSTSKIKGRTELIILMRPEVTLTKLDLYRLRQKTEDKMHLGPELQENDVLPPVDKSLLPPDLPPAK